jgi:hypothetical protein
LLYSRSGELTGRKMIASLQKLGPHAVVQVAVRNRVVVEPVGMMAQRSRGKKMSGITETYRDA